MSARSLVLPLPNSMVIEVAGRDASKVLNNLSTNDIQRLAVGDHCETFVTDLRGWTVGHGFLLKLEDRVVLVGQHTSSTSVCAHIDRYIIREEAAVANLSDSNEVWLFDEAPTETPRASRVEGQSLQMAAAITGPNCEVLVGVPSIFDGCRDDALNENDFDVRRIRNFWPVFGKDILEKCIPQELDRDSKAISFTKGCYLGQETIARLDARGQLQKKLCLLKFAAGGPREGDLLTKDDKEVGRITSIAFDSADQASYALAFLRRGNFDAGTEVNCGDCCGTVLKTP